jgi:hypothetical protein
MSCADLGGCDSINECRLLRSLHFIFQSLAQASLARFVK